jgi:integrase
MVLPFSIFLRNDRPNYYVAFKNEETGEYLPAVGTKKETEAEAIKTAFQWIRDGIPRKGEAVPFKKYTLRDMAKGADINGPDADFICKKLQRRGLLKTYILSSSEQAVDFGDYFSAFWDYDRSPYVKEKLRKNHGIHRYYCREQYLTVQRNWLPIFAGRPLGSITKKDIEVFMDSLDSRERKLSAARKNIIIKAGTIPLKWAFYNEMISRDITAGLTWFHGKAAERQILTPELAAAVFRVPWKDERTWLANLLAAVTGMRAGELQGLRIQDLGRDCLYIRHSWNCRDGLKTTKNNESRTVKLPFPGVIRDLLNLATRNPHGGGMDAFIFWAALKPDKPIEERLLLDDLRGALVKTGMSKETAKVYTFHAWRHFFTAYMRPGLMKSCGGNRRGIKPYSHAGSLLGPRS